MITRIIYPTYTLKIRVLKPEAELETERLTTSTQDFLTAFKALGLKSKAPLRPWQPDDYGIAARLLKTYDCTLLLEYSRLFWTLFSDPIYLRPDDTHIMRLFSSRLTEIKAAL